MSARPPRADISPAIALPSPLPHSLRQQPREHTTSERFAQHLCELQVQAAPYCLGILQLPRAAVMSALRGGEGKSGATPVRSMSTPTCMLPALSDECVVSSFKTELSQELGI